MWPSHTKPPATSVCPWLHSPPTLLILSPSARYVPMDAEAWLRRPGVGLFTPCQPKARFLNTSERGKNVLVCFTPLPAPRPCISHHPSWGLAAALGFEDIINITKRAVTSQQPGEKQKGTAIRDLLGKPGGGSTRRVMEKQWAALIALPSFSSPLLSCPPSSSTCFSTLSSFPSRSVCRPADVLPWHYLPRAASLHVNEVLHSSVDECRCQLERSSSLPHRHTRRLLLPPHPLVNRAVRGSFIRNGPL